MNNKRILVVTTLIMILLMAGVVSASGFYNDSAAAVGQDTAKSSGAGYALLVAVSDYKDPSIEDLEGKVYDIPNMKNMLINNCGYSSSQIVTLQDSKATKSAVRSALTQMSSRVGSGDTMVVYFSGHGYVYPEGYGTSYICTYDSEIAANYFGISSSELKLWLDGIRCKNVLVIIDACYSEGMMKGGTKDLVNASLVKTGANKISDADLFSQNFIAPFENQGNLAQSSGEQQKAITGNQYVVLVASRSYEYSYVNAVYGSWLTAFFIEGIGKSSTDTNFDNWVSAEEAFYYASPRATLKHSDQHPVIYDGDFFNDLRMANYMSSQVGTIDIKSSPTGARIYLDGTDTGYSAPRVISGVSAGTHTVRCSMTGYTDQTQSVTVTAGTTTSVTLTLPKQGQTGMISVSSSPTGARVYLDGTDTGYSTPRVISGVSAGTHTVRCSMTGYTDQTQSVTVTAGTTTSVTLTLPKQGQTGMISVSSSPTGARVYLDGSDTGYSTPRVISGVSAGTHTVRCSMTGYIDQTQSVTVTAGKTTSVTLTLPKQGQTGTISVSSSPTGASVYLDGTYTSKTTPTTLTGLSAGIHTIVLKKSGYPDYSTSVTVQGGQMASVSVTLAVQASTGMISVSSSPTGARIYLDGSATGYSTPRVISGVSAGTHTVRCSMTGYTDQTQSVTVTAGKTTSVTLTLPKQGQTGMISVSSSPNGARIYLDGSDTGFSTPQTISGISAGTHTVRCSMTGYTDQTQSVTVTAGKTTSVTLTLQKSSSTDPIIGGWRQVASGGYDDRYRFNADGTWKESYYFLDTGRTAVFSGTWIANGDNSYTLRVTTTGTTKTMIYDPAQNGIYDPRFPSLVKYPYTGDIAPASSSVSSPIIGVWRYDCQTFDDRYHFYADGTYVESFYSYTRGTLSVYSGTWTANTGNSYTLLMTGESPVTIIYDPARNTIYDTRYAPLLYSSYQGDVMKGIVSSEIKQPVTMFSESEKGNIQFVLNDKARMPIKA